MEIKNVLILGLGAIGTIYAVKLNEIANISVLVDKSRIDRYKANGIIFNSKRYDFNLVLDTDSGFCADLIIVATKSINFSQTADMIKNYVGKNTIILSLLNGITSENVLAQKYGQDKVLPAFFIGHSSMRIGNSVSFDGVGKVVFGEVDNSYSQKVQSLEKFFNSANLDYRISKDITTELWQKLIVNIGVNQALAIYKKTFGALKDENNKVRLFAINLMSEAIEVANAIGIKDSDKFLQYTLDYIATVPSNCKPSMLQDIEHGKPTEIESFAGEILRLGKENNIQTPYNTKVFNALTSYNNTVSMS